MLNSWSWAEAMWIRDIWKGISRCVLRLVNFASRLHDQRNLGVVHYTCVDAWSYTVGSSWFRGWIWQQRKLFIWFMCLLFRMEWRSRVFFFFCPSEPEMQPSTRSCPVLNISSCDLPISHANALLVQVQLYTVQFGAAQEPGSVCSVLQKIQVPGQSRKTKRWF